MPCRSDACRAREPSPKRCAAGGGRRRPGHAPEAAALGQTIDTGIRAIDASDFNDRIVAMQEQVAGLIKRYGPHPGCIKALGTVQRWS